jgi:uncharacterized protein YcgI (DUF1989 family)
VKLYEAQLRLLDELVDLDSTEASRESVLRATVFAHLEERISGRATEYVGGQTGRDAITVRFPDYGAVAFEHRIVPVEGKAVLVRKGQILRISQAVGGTCVDFNAFNAEDYKEAMDCGFTRSSQSFNPGLGEFIWTNAPRGRPMFGILAIADSCELDITGHRCNRMYQDLGWGMSDHVNCQDTLAEAIREFGLTPDDVHDSFNMWMATTVDAAGRRQFRWNPGQAGDSIDLLVMFDVVAAAVICGSGDLVGINNFEFQPIDLTVFESTESTRALVDTVSAKWSGRASQVSTSDLTSVQVRAERRLEKLPDYQPNYRPAPEITEVPMSLTADERKVLNALCASGVYGRTEGEVVRAAFMRWCNAHHTLFQKPFLSFEDHVPASA